MRILAISNLYPPESLGGYEQRCFLLMNYLASRGHAVRLLCSDYSQSSKEGKIQVNEKQQHPRHPDSFVQVDRCLKIHGLLGPPWLSIGALFWQERWNQKQLKRLIQEHKPDCILLSCMGGISKSLIHTAESMGIPLVYDISDHWVQRAPEADVWLSWWNRSASLPKSFIRKFAHYSGIQALISRAVPTKPFSSIQFSWAYYCSSFLEELTASAGFRAKNSQVIYCGIDIKQFQKKQSYLVSKDRKQLRSLLFVGRLDADKDPLGVIELVRDLILEEGWNLELDLYGRGEGEYLQQMKAVISSAKLDSKIKIKSCSAEEMTSLYSGYDAMIFNSNWGEPFALTPLEGMASALPVIFSTDGGQRELADQLGENCWAFEAGDRAQLQRQLISFLESEDGGESWAQSHCRFVNSANHIEGVCQKIESILLQASQSSSSAQVQALAESSRAAEYEPKSHQK